MTRFLSVTHLRIALLVVNLALVSGVVIGAYKGYQRDDTASDSGRTAATIKERDLKEFLYHKDPRFTLPSANATREIAIVGTRLQPRKVKPLPAGASPSSEDPGALDEVADEIEGGPLAENEWEYYHYIGWSKDPMRNWVGIRKKQTSKSSTPRRSFTSRRPNTRRPASSRARTTTRPVAAAPSVFFSVSDRKVLIDDEELTFFVHSADPKKLVYWVEESGPTKMYSLAYVPEGPYLTRPEDGLRPEENEEEEGAEEDEGPKFIVRHTSATPAADREREYQRSLRTRTVSDALKAKRVRKSSPARPGSRTSIRNRSSSQTSSRSSSRANRRSPTNRAKSATPTSRSPANSASSSTPRGATGGNTPPAPKSKAEQIDELREGIKDLPPDAKRQVEEALTGSPSP